MLIHIKTAIYTVGTHVYVIVNIDAIIHKGKMESKDHDYSQKHSAENKVEWVQSSFSTLLRIITDISLLDTSFTALWKNKPGNVKHMHKG